jgi:hypothetical protein
MALNRNAATRVLLLFASPLTILFAALAAYAVLSCGALERFSWQWWLLIVFPAGTLAASASMLHSAIARKPRSGLLALIAAVATMVSWMDLAFGSVF